MLQESVYSKLTLNLTITSAVTDRIKKHKPPEGIVQLLTITEKQYNTMEFIVGEKHTDIIDSDERLVVL